jgi:hypothetical protein
MQLLASLLLPIINDAHAPVSAVVLFFAFLIGHALGDYPLQGKFLAIRKNRHIKMVDYTGETPGTLWVYCLSAHALVHAGIVWLILEGFKLPYAVEIAFAEFLLHWFIDFAKCERWTNFHADQGLHLICKLGYIGCFYVL